MNLRPYQQEFIDAVHHAFAEGNRRIMGVAATGAGKTILAAELMRQEQGNCLFLADAKELINQNADKYFTHTGERAGVEMGPQSSRLGVDRVVVATAQSLHRRLQKFEEDHFNLIIVDECHRATLGEASQKIFNHFSYARILGITATPFRSDRKELGNFYERIAIEVGLDRLIREGYLSRIQIKSFPMSIDLRDVGVRGGDYAADDLGAVIEPILQEAANQLVTHAADRRKIVVFLPLVKTSIRMARILNEMGIKAVHVSGEDRTNLAKFTHGDARVICNAQLLTTGWDCPQVDCVLVLRPTKSLSLYSQMVGRGTRIHPDKDKLLLLDPLFLSDDHRLITPARLVARDEEQAKAMMEKIAEDGGGDLLGVEVDIEEKRAEALKARMEAKQKKKGRVVDAIEFALSCGEVETAEFQPEFGWEANPPSPKQVDALNRAGFDVEEIKTRGQASKVLDLLFLRRQKGLATPKQLKLMKQFGHPDPANVTFDEASKWIDRAFGSKGIRRESGASAPLPTKLLIRLRAAGLRARDYADAESAEEALRKIGAAA